MKNDTMNIIEVYKSMLPHGSKAIIAKRAGVTNQAVSLFFSGRNKSKRIEDATLQYIAELRADREKKFKDAGLLW